MAAIPSACIKPHALIVPIPAHSHIYPMLQLGFNLLSSGLVITFASPERTHSHIMKLGKERLCQQGYGSAEFHIIKIPDGLPVFTKIDRPSAARFGEAIAKIEVAVEEILDQLSKEERPVTCIISNIFLFGMQDIANKHGLPKIDFYPSAATALAIAMHMFSRISNGSCIGCGKIAGKNDQEELIAGIPGLPPLHRSAIAKELWIDDISDPMHQILFGPYRRIRESHGILVNTLYELESEVIDALRGNDLQIFPVGPLLPWSKPGDKPIDSESWIELRQKEKEKQKEEETAEKCCMGWLREQEPGSVVYVAFGSLAVLSAAEVEEIAAGLEESGEAFLWVVDAALLSRGFQERTRGRGMVVSWAPQLSVLGCGSVGVFLSHCGWNSTLESLSMGVPMVGWPIEQEQVTNLHLITQLWHVGVALSSLSRAHVSSSVTKVLHSTDLHARATALHSSAYCAMIRGSSTSSSHAFINDISCKTCT